MESIFFDMAQFHHVSVTGNILNMIAVERISLFFSVNCVTFFLFKEIHSFPCYCRSVAAAAAAAGCKRKETGVCMCVHQQKKRLNSSHLDVLSKAICDLLLKYTQHGNARIFLDALCVWHQKVRHRFHSDSVLEIVPV